jgi:hypothetical protein
MSATLVAQGRDDQYTYERPRQFGNRVDYGTVLGQIRDGALLNRAVRFDGPVNTGLLRDELPDEALVDLEAWLREPIPEDEVALRRVGFARPARGTIWREEHQLPDEELLRRHEELLRPTIDRMQGVWRVQKMTLDGRVLTPEQFAGLKYLVQDQVLFQNEYSENWTRSAPVSTKKAAGQATRLPGKEPGERGAIRPAEPDQPDRLGPAGTTRPAGGGTRNDPRQEEGVRLQMLQRNNGLVSVYWWDRDGEVVDPHESRNRPSLRVAWPVRGAFQLTDNTLVFGARGVGLRAVLPSKFHYRFNRMITPPYEEQTRIEGERTVLLVLVRDEAIKNPMSESQAGSADGNLGAGEPGSRGRRNIIPQMERVPMAKPQMQRVPLPKAGK